MLNNIKKISAITALTVATTGLMTAGTAVNATAATTTTTVGAAAAVPTVPATLAMVNQAKKNLDAANVAVAKTKAAYLKAKASSDRSTKITVASEKKAKAATKKARTAKAKRAAAALRKKAKANRVITNKALARTKTAYAAYAKAVKAQKTAAANYITILKAYKAGGKVPTSIVPKMPPIVVLPPQTEPVTPGDSGTLPAPGVTYGLQKSSSPLYNQKSKVTATYIGSTCGRKPGNANYWLVKSKWRLSGDVFTYVPDGDKTVNVYKSSYEVTSLGTFEVYRNETSTTFNDYSAFLRVVISGWGTDDFGDKPEILEAIAHTSITCKA